MASATLVALVTVTMEVRVARDTQLCHSVPSMFRAIRVRTIVALLDHLFLGPFVLLSQKNYQRALQACPVLPRLRNVGAEMP